MARPPGVAPADAPGAPLACRHRPACPGCPWLELGATEQRARKRARLVEALEEAGVRTLGPGAVAEVFEGPTRVAYRNRAKLVFAGPGQDPRAERRGTEVGRGSMRALRLGLYREGSHTVVDTAGCLVERPAIGGALTVLRRVLRQVGVRPYDERTREGDLRYVSVREGTRTGELLVGFVTARTSWAEARAVVDALEAEDLPLVGVVQNVNPTGGNAIFGAETQILTGRGHVVEEVLDVRLCLGLRSFFQVNTPVAERAYERLVAGLEIGSDDTLLDLYGGVGAIGLVGAGRAARAVVVEENAEAITLAVQSAAESGRQNVECVLGRVEEHVARLVAGTDARRTVVAVNPPRKGLAPPVVASLAAARPRRLAYLSCEPATLARDLARFEDAGYRVLSCEPFDMFPQTDQVETLAILA